MKAECNLKFGLRMMWEGIVCEFFVRNTSLHVHACSDTVASSLQLVVCVL